MSKELHEQESFERFKEIIPRNPYDWEGSVVLYSAWTESFFNVAFGTGGNLDGDDIDDGIDDYIMVELYAQTGEVPLKDIICRAKNTGYIDSDTPGLREYDGGQLLLRRCEWENGDIRRFIMEALEFAGYGAPEGPQKAGPQAEYNGIIYIGADYDLWHEKGGENG